MAQNGIVTSVGSLGKSLEASDNRGYWNNPEIYLNRNKLQEDWEEFLSESRAHGNRRTMMRVLFPRNQYSTLKGLPVEAIIVRQSKLFVYLGQNEHQLISEIRKPIATRETAVADLAPLREGFTLDSKVCKADAEDLFELWEQFGWTYDGVKTFIRKNKKPIQVIRYQDRVVAAMIAESLQFAKRFWIVELTEMGVKPYFQGLGLSKVLIQHLAAQSYRRFGVNSLVYGEFNMSTFAHCAAFSAGMNAAYSLTLNADGVLRDHVSIKVGDQKENVPPWKTQHLHSFQVMYMTGLPSELR
jgi:hypothetical protein